MTDTEAGIVRQKDQLLRLSAAEKSAGEFLTGLVDDALYEALNNETYASQGAGHRFDYADRIALLEGVAAARRSAACQAVWDFANARVGTGSRATDDDIRAWLERYRESIGGGHIRCLTKAGSGEKIVSGRAAPSDAAMTGNATAVQVATVPPAADSGDAARQEARDGSRCDKCNAKTFYDASLWEYASEDGPYTRVGNMVVLCKQCAEKYEVKIVERTPKEARDGEHADSSARCSLCGGLRMVSR